MKQHSKRETQINHQQVRAYMGALFPYYKVLILAAMLWASGASVENVIALLK